MTEALSASGFSIHQGITRSICMVLFMLASGSAFAQEETGSSSSSFEWEWGALGGLGYFNFRNSLFVDKAPDPPSNLSDDWGEFFIKPWASFEWSPGVGTFFGKASWAYAKTGEEASEISGGGATSSDLDDFYVGWRSGEEGGDGWILGGGRYPWVLANQFLIADGYADGGSRAGYWSNPRRAWKFGAQVSYVTGPHAFDVAYLERDERPESDTQTKISIANYDLSLAEDKWLLGVSWLGLEANELAPQRDGADVWNLRAYIKPIDAPLVIEMEYVREDNGLALDAIGWYFQPYWTFGEGNWATTAYYRYTYFEGDDPNTLANEAYDPLFPGFYDWGSWWQGEIAGEYFLSNSNLKTHMLRVHTKPRSNIGTGLIWFTYNLDQPGSYQGGVSSSDLGNEINWYMDWKFHDYFTLSFVLARTDPGQAVAEAFERTKPFKYGMIYLAMNY